MLSQSESSEASGESDGSAHSDNDQEYVDDLKESRQLRPKTRSGLRKKRRLYVGKSRKKSKRGKAKSRESVNRPNSSATTTLGNWREPEKLKNVFYKPSSEPKQTNKSPAYSLAPPKNSISNPFAKAIVSPCCVKMHPLSEEFIGDALIGKVDWSVLFKSKKKVLDWEGYYSRKMNNPDWTDDNLSLVPSEPEEILTAPTESKTRSSKRKKSKKSRESKRSKNVNYQYDESDYIEEENDELLLPESDHDVEYEPDQFERRLLRTRTPRASKKPKVLQCKECSFTTDEEQILLLHGTLHKTVCKECNLSFENKFKLQKHNYEIHKPPVELKYHTVYGCKICKLYFDDVAAANFHICTHKDASEDGKFACLMCQNKFSREISLENHLIAKHLFYKCTFCDFLASSIDFVERHSLSTHAAYGQPYACDLCDFRSSTFGAQITHRKTIHALEKEGDHERCRLCAYLLVNDKETILEHLAGHGGIALFECKHCENIKSNSYSLMREHGITFHASSDIESFAKMFDSNIMAERIKVALSQRMSKTQNKSKKGRCKPSVLETKDAIAGICSPDVSSTYDPILTSSSDTISHTWSTPVYTQSFTVIDPSQALKSDAITEQPDSSSGPSNVIFAAGSSDSLSLSMQTIDGVTNLPQPAEGVLSVDPTTGQLFLQGLPVLDEKGNSILVSMSGPQAQQATIDLDMSTFNSADLLQSESLTQLDFHNLDN